MIVYELKCEDASALGGPMGTEQTEFLWNELHKKKETAQKAALKHRKTSLYGGKVDADWKKNGKQLVWDAGSYIYTISKKEVLE